MSHPNPGASGPAILTAADVEAMPDSDERAVLLAALGADNHAETELGWDSPPVVIKFVHTPDRSTAPAATIKPLGLADPAPITELMIELAAKLIEMPALRAKLVEPNDTYLGLCLSFEGWRTTIHPLTGAKNRIEVRFLCGALTNGRKFYLQRTRGEQPEISFDTTRLPSQTDDIYAAVVALNTAFTDAYHQ